MTMEHWHRQLRAPAAAPAMRARRADRCGAQTGHRRSRCRAEATSSIPCARQVPMWTGRSPRRTAHRSTARGGMPRPSPAGAGVNSVYVRSVRPPRSPARASASSRRRWCAPSARRDASARYGREAARRSTTICLTWSAETRSWVIESRSRIVTLPSSSDSTSTVTHHGVPISSWRR